MPKKVLVIDDDANTVKYLSVALRRHGYEAIAAYDGKEGVEVVGESRPDLIVLDIMMPGKSGWVVFRELRRHDVYKSIPIIMLTAVSHVLDEQDARAEEEAEYDGLRELLRKAIQSMREEGLERPELFVDKPVDPEALIEKIRELIG
jgi:CheY-like chemotaxis protein